MKPNTVFASAKLSSNFSVKDPALFAKKHDVICGSVCASESCNLHYVGESARRFYERVKDHNDRDH